MCTRRLYQNSEKFRLQLCNWVWIKKGNYLKIMVEILFRLWQVFFYSNGEWVEKSHLWDLENLVKTFDSFHFWNMDFQWIVAIVLQATLHQIPRKKLNFRVILIRYDDCNLIFLKFPETLEYKPEILQDI